MYGNLIRLIGKFVFSGRNLRCTLLKYLKRVSFLQRLYRHIFHFKTNYRDIQNDVITESKFGYK